MLDLCDPNKLAAANGLDDAIRHGDAIRHRGAIPLGPTDVIRLPDCAGSAGLIDLIDSIELDGVNVVRLAGDIGVFVAIADVIAEDKSDNFSFGRTAGIDKPVGTRVTGRLPVGPMGKYLGSAFR